MTEVRVSATELRDLIERLAREYPMFTHAQVAHLAATMTVENEMARQNAGEPVDTSPPNS